MSSLTGLQRGVHKCSAAPSGDHYGQVRILEYELVVIILPGLLSTSKLSFITLLDLKQN